MTSTEMPSTLAVSSTSEQPNFLGTNGAPLTNADVDGGYDSPDIGDDGSSSPSSSFMVREQDRLLPIANVSRIMKMAVPPNAKIAKDAKETVQECVSEFIAFVTSEASDRCAQEKRKTINGDDILWAMESLGFDNYVQILKIYLQKYKESMKMNERESPAIGGVSMYNE